MTFISLAFKWAMKFNKDLLLISFFHRLITSQSIVIIARIGVSINQKIEFWLIILRIDQNTFLNDNLKYVIDQNSTLDVIEAFTFIQL